MWTNSLKRWRDLVSPLLRLLDPVHRLEDPVTIGAADKAPEQGIEAVGPDQSALPQFRQHLFRLFPPAQFDQTARKETLAQG